MTVEMALVFPLFLMAMLSLLSVTSFFYINSNIEHAVNEEAKTIAVKKFDESDYGFGGIKANIQYNLESSLGKKQAEALNLVFEKSDVTNPELTIIDVSYSFSPPFIPFSTYSIPFEKRVVIHNWTGYINGLNSLSGDFEYVYVTKTGKVYHRSRECSHIRLTICHVSGKDIKNMRNEQGEKYKKCIYCKPKLTDENLYITTDGNRYHNTLMCGGLKRTVTRIKITEIGDRLPCSRCGY